MKKFLTFLLYIVLPVAIIGAIFLIGWGADFGKPHNLALKDALAGNIGSINAKNLTVEKDFIVVNQGKSDIVISRIYTNCGCLSVVVPVGNYTFGPFSIPLEQNVKPLGILIPAGGEMTIKMALNLSDSPAGNFSGGIFIEAQTAGELFEIPIKGFIVKQ